MIENEESDAISESDLSGIDSDSNEDFQINYNEAVNVKKFPAKIDSKTFSELGFYFKNQKMQRRFRPSIGWADIMYDVIYETTLLNCPLSIRYKSKKFIVHGKCPDQICSCEVFVEVITESSEKVVNEEIMVTIILINYNESLEHTKKKRRVRFKVREQFKALLKTNSVHNAKNNLNLKYAALGAKKKPPHYPNDHVLHKISSSNNTNKKEVVANLYNICHKYVFIKHLQLYPEINIVFFSNVQVYFYQNYRKNNLIQLSLDDTGDVSCNLRNDKSDDLNLFQLVIRRERLKSLPIGQMISSKKDAPSINLFLRVWLNEFQFEPNIVVMDGAGALHLAVCQVFNKIELSEYLDHCWAVVRKEIKFKLSTVLRLDRVHYAKIILDHIKIGSKSKGKTEADDRIINTAKKNPEHQQHKRAKLNLDVEDQAKKVDPFDTYARSLILCIDLGSFEEIKNVFGAVIFLASQEKEAKETLKCRQFLELFIEGKSMESPIEFISTPDSSWVQQLIKQSENFQYHSYNLKNSSYYPELPKYMKYLGRLIMLWSPLISNLVHNVREVNSTNVESFFSLLKNNVLQEKIHTLDEFLEIFYNYSLGAFALDDDDGKYFFVIFL